MLTSSPQKFLRLPTVRRAAFNIVPPMLGEKLARTIALRYFRYLSTIEIAKAGDVHAAAYAAFKLFGYRVGLRQTARWHHSSKCDL